MNNQPEEMEQCVNVGRIAHSVSDLYFEKSVREIERLNEVLASIDAATNLKAARRWAKEGRTAW